MDQLTTLSPLDGRYRSDVAALEAYFSEAALFRYRARIEIEYLIFLTKARDVRFVPKLEAQAAAELRGLYRSFRPEDAEAIAAWDRKVNHDVKAVEYWLREQMDKEQALFKALQPFQHLSQGHQFLCRCQFDERKF